MKTLLLTVLTFAGIALCTPEAQARDVRYSNRGYSSYRAARSLYGHGHYYNRGYHSPRYYSYGSRYAYPGYAYGSRYYYHPVRSYYRPYYYSDYCGPRGYAYYGAPRISFSFGF